jgi:hypothetical protein
MGAILSNGRTEARAHDLLHVTASGMHGSRIALRNRHRQSRPCASDDRPAAGVDWGFAPGDESSVVPET